MKRKSGKSGLTLVLVLCIALAALVLLFCLFDRLSDYFDTNSSDLTGDGSEAEILYYNSVPYTPKDDLETILFIGLDTRGKIAEMEDPHLADFLILAIIDNEEEKISFLHLNRDTMVYADQLDHADQPEAILYTQLARSHIFGSSETVRSHNTMHAVQGLLYDISVDHYITMTMDAVAKINDAVGGISLSLLDDFTHIDPSFTEGATVKLSGEQALVYIRARREMEDATNLSRMERQKQYMEKMLTVYLNMIAGDQGTMDRMSVDLMSYMHTDFTIHQMSVLSKKIKDYTVEGIKALVGEAIVGDKFMEYYVDETALQEMVLSLFYELYSEK